MKVLHVIPSLWSGDGGPAHAVLAMERALVAQGVDVELATTDDDGPGRRSGKSGLLRENGGAHRYFGKRSDFYKWSPSFARWISQAVHGYDLLHLHALFSFTTTAASQAARRSGVPYVVRPLGTLDAWGLGHRRPWLKRASLALVEKPLLRDAAAVHFTSEAEKREAEALGVPMRSAVIPLGIDMPRALPHRDDTDAATALYLSRLTPKKNVEGLLEAFAMVKDEWPGLRLRIAGDGEPAYVRELHARAAQLGLGARIAWLGHLSGEAKENAFAGASFFVLASHSENFGIAAAEALARGLPCVLGAGVALARDVESAGAGVQVATDARSIARGLRLMMPPATRASMSAAASQLASKRYSLDAMGASLKQLYSDILAGSHGIPARR